MADPKPRGRVSNFLFRGLDRLVPGNNYNRATGQFRATPLQWAGGAAGLVGNMFFPGAGTAARTAIHGYTTGEGVAGFLQPNNRSGQLAAAFRGGNFTQAPLDPAAAIPYNPQLPSLNPTQRFDPNGNSQTSQGGAPQTTQRQLAPTTGMAGLTGIASEMGGARGAHSQGGIAGDAARAWMEAMRNAPMTIDTGIRGPMLQ